MQTFLPFSDFAASVKALDDRRCGKQRVEAYQILRVLNGLSKGWRRHPAVLMWDGYTEALALYMNAAIAEWVARGFRNSMTLQPVGVEPPMPPWLGDGAFHLSHRSNLVRKMPSHYAVFWPDVPPDLPYVWPVKAAAK